MTNEPLGSLRACQGCPPQRARSAAVKCSQLPALQAKVCPTAPKISVGAVVEDALGGINGTGKGLGIVIGAERTLGGALLGISGLTVRSLGKLLPGTGRVRIVSMMGLVRKSKGCTAKTKKKKKSACSSPTSTQETVRAMFLRRCSAAVGPRMGGRNKGCARVLSIVKTSIPALKIAPASLAYRSLRHRKTGPSQWRQPLNNATAAFMLIFLINLKRRLDRLERMEEQARFLGLNFERIEALDWRLSAVESVNTWFGGKGPLGEIALGDKCCLLSHRLAWARFLESGQSHSVFLEDDVKLSDNARALLDHCDWLTEDMDLVKLEHFGPPGQRVLLSGLKKVSADFQAGQMLSRHTGAAAYILTRKAAQKLLAQTRFELPVDHLLFNPNNSPMFAQLAPWQLLPAIARQQEFEREKSDIEQSRTGLRRFNRAYVKRELVRFGYDLKLLPRQLCALLKGRAKFIAIKIA